MLRIKTALILILTLLIYLSSNSIITAQPSVPDTVLNGPKGQEMNVYLERLSDFGFHGSVLVARNDTILLHRAYGLANVPDQIPNYTSTLFSTGSVTKQFTAAAIIYLESSGKLSTVDSINRYFMNVPPDKSGITIHHLLTHTSGLAHAYGSDEDSIGRDLFIANVLAQPLEFEPGKQYSYSNAGYSLLAAIIEMVSDENYEAFLQESLFERLGMNHTGLHLLNVDDTLFAHSHNEEIGYPSPANRPENAWNLIGNGGILSTTGDMYRWYTALRESEILPPEFTDKIFTPYVREYPDMESYYGYGWVIQDSERRDSKIIWHNGGAMPHGWSCALYNYVADSAIFIVFSNKPMDGILPVDHIAVGLSRILFGEKLELPPQTASIDDSLFEKLEDLYLINDTALIRVTVSDDMLHLHPIGQDAVNAVYPSPMQDMLPKYNTKTDQMLKALADGDFETAAEFWSKRPGSDPVGMLRQWWSSYDSLGQVRNHVILGTKMGDGAHTYCRVNFENGTVNLMFGWMRGFCRGAMDGKKLVKPMHPAAKDRFVSYSLTEGSILNAIFMRDNSLVIRSDKKSITAQRK